MTNWMLWSILFATLVALSALAIERVATQFAFSRRIVWICALLACAIVPAIVALQPLPLTDTPKLSTGETVAPQPAARFELIPVTAAGFADDTAGAARFDVDVWAFRLWVLMSSLVLGTFAVAALGLWRKSAKWREADLKLCRALITKDVGPAVVGFLRPRVVVPQWALHVEESARQMMLQHEVEHLRARDPQMLFVSGILLIVFPWNVALWWIVQRMRVAMELDCDARVVRSIGTSYEYGQVLLAVGERHIKALPLATSLTGRRPLLEWRIKAMTMKKPRRPLLSSIPFAALAFVAMTAATRAPHPAPLNYEMPVTADNNISFVAPQIVSQDLQAGRVADAPVTPVVTHAPPARAVDRAATVVEVQAYPSRAQIAAMLTANVPELMNPNDSSNYAVLVLDASNRYSTASAGRGTLTLQVWGDTLDAAGRAVRARERQSNAVPTAGAGRVGSVGGGRGAAGSVGAAGARGVAASGGARGVAGGGGRGAAGAAGLAMRSDSTGRVRLSLDSARARAVTRMGSDSFVRGTVAGGRVTGGAGAGAGAGAVGGGARGGGARGGGGGGGRGAGAAAVGQAQQSAAADRLQYVLGVNGLRSAANRRTPEFLAAYSGASNSAPAYAYAVRLLYDPVNDPTSWVEGKVVTNGARGLHVIRTSSNDDSGIDGIRASSLTSLETFQFTSEFGNRIVDVVVVTKR